MLADYPAIVDYNFSPVQSPLFHQDVDSDDIFVPGHYEDEMDLPLGADMHVGLTDDLPLLLDDDDVSSIAASIQTSDPIDQEDEPALMQEDGTRRHGVRGQDAPVVGGDAAEGGACEEGLFGSAGSDYLSQGYLSAMQHSSLEGDPSLALLTLVASDLDVCIASNVEVSDLPGNKSRIAGERPASSTTTSQTSEGRRRKKKKTEDKRWSEMTEDEKDDVAEHLTSVLRSLLGPRERMEVLAMILPERRAGLSDRDFVIESHMLNESTLARLETYLEENEMTGEASDSELVLSQPRRKRGCFAAGAGRRKCTSLPASPQHRGSFAEDHAPLGGRKPSKRQTSLRTWGRSTRKDYRQASKERRSGLFHREEVLSLSQCIQEDEDEEEEIDILG